MFTPSKLPGEAGLLEDMGRLAFYPLEFVQYAYPWGEENTPLERYDGPDGWQTEVLQEIGLQVRNNAFDGINPVKPIRILIHSGHGVGKSAKLSWLADWIRSTRVNSHGTITANTLKQLKNRTWVAIRKWGGLSITSPWFNIKAESVTHKQYSDWRLDMQTCNEENSESFAGQHCADSTSYFLFDEGSNIPNVIFEVAEGGLTDGEPMIFVCGNPTRNSGVFYEIMRGKKRKYWFVKQVDSREAKMTNKAGEPPKSDSLQFITEDMLNPALGRQIAREAYYHAPIIIGCDPAWQGEDFTGL
jgi:hypothetical protein